MSTAETQPASTSARWTRLDSAALVASVVAAAVLRLVGLGRPAELVFDEIFYARDACWYLFAAHDPCGVTDLVSRAHPPLGKWLVAFGIAAFGYEPFGWRISVAVAGIASVALLYLLAWRLIGWVASGRAVTVGAGVASGLLATDLLHLVQSRVAMLDAFIGLFVIGAVLAVVLDRERPLERERQSLASRLTLGRPWLVVAGACVGAATGVKWSGAYVAPAVIGLVVAWSVADARGRHPDAGWGRWVVDAVRREAGTAVVLLGLVPLAVYLAGYTGRMPGEVLALPWTDGSVWRGIWEHGRAMLEFHTQLSGNHPYQSPPWAWPLLQRPVAYWFGDDGGAYREILALGNPAVWWPGLLALAGLAVTWWRAGFRLWRPEPVIIAAALATFIPWLVLSGDRGQTFLWYFLPTVPFLTLALGLFAAWAWERARGRVALAAYGLVVGATFAFWLPVVVALPLEPESWRTRILFSDCERRDGSVQRLPDDSTSQGDPPRGWCWI